MREKRPCVGNRAEQSLSSTLGPNPPNNVQRLNNNNMRASIWAEIWKFLICLFLFEFFFSSASNNSSETPSSSSPRRFNASTPLCRRPIKCRFYIPFGRWISVFILLQNATIFRSVGTAVLLNFIGQCWTAIDAALKTAKCRINDTTRNRRANNNVVIDLFRCAKMKRKSDVGIDMVVAVTAKKKVKVHDSVAVGMPFTKIRKKPKTIKYS